MNKSFFISGGNRFGEQHVLRKYGFVSSPTMEDADFVVFTGGADIDPSIYKSKAHASTHANTGRDRMEIADFHRAKELGKAMLGICRGAQLLNCLAGGSLYQDIRHPGYHLLITDDGQLFPSNSVHHQMLRVAEGAIIKAWTPSLSPYHLHMDGGVEGNDVVVEKEPEIVVYPEHRMVLVQGHPEFDSENPQLHTFRQYVFNLIQGA